MPRLQALAQEFRLFTPPNKPIWWVPFRLHFPDELLQDKELALGHPVREGVERKFGANRLPLRGFGSQSPHPPAADGRRGAWLWPFS